MTQDQASKIVARFANDLPQLTEAFRVFMDAIVQELKPKVHAFINGLRTMLLEIHRRAAEGDEECIAFLREIGVEVPELAATSVIVEQ